VRILIADDDEIQLDLLTAHLEGDGDEIMQAHNGEEAYRLYQEWQPQMAILDWVMPGMDGVEVCRRIRRHSGMSYVYIMLVTARRDSQDVIDGLSSGADDFLPKPYDPGELKVRMNAGRRILSMETRHVAIFALAKLADSRDPETGLHLERMREFARVLAREVARQEDRRDRLPPDFVDIIYLTSPLHDIGKVGIPDCVLLKPGRLTDEEFVIMKRHTTIGGETLGAAVSAYPGIEYLRTARDIAIGHHERFDGTGYPNGLKKEEIPLAARIVALADVYDALTCKRVYKSAYTHDIAKRMIMEGSGKQFDPRVVEAFLSCEQDFVDIKERFSEEMLEEHAHPLGVPASPGQSRSRSQER
jgi:putative two-component system response regulator